MHLFGNNKQQSRSFVITSTTLFRNETALVLAVAVQDEDIPGRTKGCPKIYQTPCIEKFEGPVYTGFPADNAKDENNKNCHRKRDETNANSMHKKIWHAI